MRLDARRPLKDKVKVALYLVGLTVVTALSAVFDRIASLLHRKGERNEEK